MEGVELLRAVWGLGSDDPGGLDQLEPGYVVTIDTIIKMLSIQLRLRSVPPP